MNRFKSVPRQADNTDRWFLADHGDVAMSQSQAFGTLLSGLGVVIYFLLTRLRSKAKEQPLWVLPGEFRGLIGSSAV